MARVGIEKLFYSILTKDDTTTLTYGVPVYLPGVKEITVNPKQNTEKIYAENKVWEQDTSLESIEVGINLADLTNAEKAKLLGHTLAAEGGIFAGGKDSAPYIALLYKANLSGGGYRYQVLYKGKLGLPQDSVKGEEGKKDYQTEEMSGIFQTTKKNGMWKYQVDSTDDLVPADIDTTFFASVIIPTKKVVTP